MKRKSLVVILVLVLVLGLMGCERKTPANSSQTEPEQQDDVQKEPETEPDDVQDLPVITLGTCKTYAALPLFYMEEAQLDVQQGFVLLVNQYDTFGALDQALQNGELDGVITDSAGVLASRSQRYPLKIVGPADNVVYLLAGSASGVSGFIECNGKMVCMPEDTGMEYIMDYILAQNDYPDTYVDKSKADAYETVLMILGEEPDLLAVLPEPYATMAISQGATVLSTSEEYGVQPFVTALCDSFLSENEELAEAFSAAYQQAATELADKSTEEKQDLFTDKTGLYVGDVQDAVIPDYRLSQIPSEEELTDIYYWCLSRELYSGEFNRDDVVYINDGARGSGCTNVSGE